MRGKTPILKMFSHPFTASEEGKYGVSAASAAFSGKISAKSKFPRQ